MLFFICLISGTQLNAQAVYTMNTSPMACDGYAYFIDSISGYTSLTWADANSTIIATDTINIDSLCAGTYTVTASGSGTNGDTTITFTIGTMSPCDYLIVNLSSYFDSGTCNGSLIAYASGGTAPYTFSWSTGGTSTGSNSSMLTGLCGGTYSVSVIDANGCMTSSSTIVALDSTQIDPCAGFNAYANVTNISGPNQCDGAIFANVSGGTSPYIYDWSNGATTPGIGGLCAGSYVLEVTDAAGCVTYAVANLFIDSTSVGDSSLTIYPYHINTSADGVCDGVLNVYTSGGIAPYYFSLSNGAGNSTGVFDSLCQGIYTVCVFDQSGDTVCVDFIISNPSNNYNNPSYGDSLFIDSIMADLQANCQLNYQGIDSVYITGYDIFGDSILVYWNVATSTGNTTLTQLYYIGGPAGVYSLGIQVYCPGKALGNYFTATDQLYYSGVLGVTENTLEDIAVYPNPVSDKLNVRFPDAGNYEVSLYDLTGRELMKGLSNNADHTQLDMTALGRGQYVLKVTGNNGFMTKSIVK